MAPRAKIDSNVTGLRFAEEQSIGVLPVSPVWEPLEPNSYSDFGGSYTAIARNPINASRQRKKGVTTDLDASGGLNNDLTQTNLRTLLQGFFFADITARTSLAVSTIDGTTEEFEPASGGAAFRAGDLLFASGFTASGNNGVHVVSGTPDATNVAVTSNLTTATGQSGRIRHVGFQFGSGEVEIVVSGTWPVLNRASGTKAFTDFNLEPGDWIFIGGDASGHKFATAACNGFARVKSITASSLTFDKTQGTMAADNGASRTIRIFFGSVLKNQTGADIKRRTYQLERELGAPDDGSANVQAEYLVGAVPSELTINIPQADKVNCDLSFVATNYETVTAGNMKSGTRPVLVESDAFNTSSDISRVKLSIYSTGSAAPTALFAYVTEMTLTINNNVSPNKAVGVLGAFDVTAGTFEVGGSITAYFSDITAVAAVRDNSDVTLDVHFVKDNAGISIDIPLISLGEGRVSVEQDQPITLPLEMMAATGAGIDSAMDYTMSMTFFDYLPNAAA